MKICRIFKSLLNTIHTLYSIHSSSSICLCVAVPVCARASFTHSLSHIHSYLLFISIIFFYKWNLHLHMYIWSIFWNNKYTYLHIYIFIYKFIYLSIYSSIHLSTFLSFPISNSHYFCGWMGNFPKKQSSSNLELIFALSHHLSLSFPPSAYLFIYLFITLSNVVNLKS